jgi:HSP20 family protein
MNTIVKNAINNGKFIPRTYTDLLDGFFKDALFESKGASFLPSTDVSEDENAFYLTVTLPGVQKEDIKIELNDGIISISGEKKINKEENGKTYHSIESYYGNFKRSFKLPENVNVEKIEAEHKDGLLNVIVPKEQAKTLKSTIQIK